MGSPEYHSAYYQANREKLVARSKQHYQDNRQAKLYYAKERREAAPEYQRNYMANWAGTKQYNITPEQRQEILDAQDGCCPGCLRVLEELDPRERATDHNHDCCPQKSRSCGRCVRGVLCQNCNRLLGLAQDDADALRRLADYLDRGPFIW